MLTKTPSIDRMPGLLALYADRLDPQDKTPLAFMKARFGIVDDPLAKAIDKKDTQTIPMFGNGNPAVDQVRSDGVVQGYHHKPKETDFIKAPNGSIDFGEITAEMSKAMRRQAGKIRLRQGNESWGLVHIEARHGKDFKALGFDSAQQFIALVAANFTKIFKGAGAALDVVIDDQRRGMLIVQLESSADGDFYDIKTATPIRRDQFKNKSPLWERVGPNTSTAVNSSSYPRSQSGNATIAQSPDKGKVQPPLGAKAKRALEHLKAGGFFRKQLQTQYRGGEKFETHLHDAHGGTVYGVGFKTFHELQTAGHLESVGGIPSSSVWRSEWKVRADQKPDDGLAGFDAVAWDKARDDRIKASRQSGMVHLDQVYASVESMRGKKIQCVHDPKETGVVRTVSNHGDVVVHWFDEYSGNKNSAQAKTEKQGRKVKDVRESWLAPTDLKDYVFAKAQFPTVLFLKGGRPGAPGLYERLVADKHGKKVTQWVKFPKGHTAAHNEAQAELFNIDGTPYQSLETRPDTTDKQRHVGMDALAALKRRVNLLRANGGSAATLLGARLYASFVASGHNQLTGQKITSPQDLAALAQVYRDPRFETFRCVFLKGDEVVGESAYTSRLPGSVRLPDDYLAQIGSDVIRFGADGYYLLHNHPSGKSFASAPDVKLTIGTHFTVPGMLGHVIVDHSEYCTISPNGQKVEVIQKPDLAGPDYHASPSLDHPMLGVKIEGPADIALAAKALQSELMGGDPILIMTKGFESRVDVLASVPHALIDTMSEKMPRAKAWLRGVGRASGAGAHAFLIVSNADYDNKKPELQRLISEGLLVDVVSAGGKSIVLHDYVSHYGPKLFQDRRPGHKVAESLADDLAAQEKYLTDGAKQLGFTDIDDMAMNDYPAFERLAVQWRVDHALYQPVAEYVVGRIESPKFKAWFSGSRVVDAAGKPLVVYHGTSKDFDAFASEKQGGNFDDYEGAFPRDGFWFTDSPSNAHWYAHVAANGLEGERSGGGQRTVPVYLSIKNPYRYTAAMFSEEGESGIPSQSDLESQGYDGLIVELTKDDEGASKAVDDYVGRMIEKNSGAYHSWSKPEQEGLHKLEDAVTVMDHTHYVAFSAAQIKSAIGNNGDFDGTNPIMTKSQPRIIFFKKAPA